MTEEEVDAAAYETRRVLDEMLDRLSHEPITVEENRIGDRIGYQLQKRAEGSRYHVSKEWKRRGKLLLARRTSHIKRPRRVG